ncbi:MAG: hypothetical protein QXO55_01990 [Candidatus Korarchaeum sp.]
MKWKGLIFGAGGVILVLTSLLVLLVDERTFLYMLRVLSSIELFIISVLMLIIAWKLLTLKPAPPAA